MTDSLKIGNIYCVGRNFRLHALELGNEVPSEPLIFMKPSHAAALLDDSELQLPGDKGEIHYELEIVIRVGDRYAPGLQPDRYIEAMTLGLDLTLRDIQSGLKAKGLPWLPAKGFKQSAPLGRWIEYPGEAALAEQEFTLVRNGQEVQRGCTKDMLLSIGQLVQYIEEQYGLGPGDIIFTGTPAGVGALCDKDKFEAYWGGQKLGGCVIKLGG